MGPRLPSGAELNVETAALTTLAALILCWASWIEGGSHALVAASAVSASAALACQMVTGVRARRLRYRHAATKRDYRSYVAVTRRWVLATVAWIAAAAGCTLWRLGVDDDSMAVTLAMTMIALLTMAAQACRNIKKAADLVLADFALADR